MNILGAATDGMIRGETGFAFDLPIYARYPNLSYQATPPAPGVPEKVGATVVVQWKHESGATRWHPAYFHHKTGKGDPSLPPAYWQAFFSPPMAGKWSARVFYQADGVPDGEADAKEAFVIGDAWKTRGVVTVAPPDVRYLRTERGVILPFAGTNAMYDPDLLSMPARTVGPIRDWWQGSNSGYAFSGLTGQGGMSGDWVNFMTSAFAGTPMTVDDAFDLVLRVWPRRADNAGKILSLGTHPYYAAHGQDEAPRKRWRAFLTFRTVGVVPRDPNTPAGVVFGRATNDSWNEAKLAGLSAIAPVDTRGLWKTVRVDFESGREAGRDWELLAALVGTDDGYFDLREWHLYEVDANGNVISGDLARTPWLAVDARMNPYASANCDARLRDLMARDLYACIVLFEREGILEGYRYDDGSFGPDYDPQSIYSRSAGKDRSASFIRWMLWERTRYFLARFGWSPSIAACELLNEGDPFDARLYETAGSLADWSRGVGEHDKLFTTSGWHSLVPRSYNKYFRPPMVAQYHSNLSMYPNWGDGNVAPCTPSLHPSYWGNDYALWPKISLEGDADKAAYLRIDSRGDAVGQGNRCTRIAAPMAIDLAGRKLVATAECRYGGLVDDPAGTDARIALRLTAFSEEGVGSPWYTTSTDFRDHPAGEWFRLEWQAPPFEVSSTGRWRELWLETFFDRVRAVVDFRNVRLIDVTDPAKPFDVWLPTIHAAMFRWGYHDILAGIDSNGVRQGTDPAGTDARIYGAAVFQGEADEATANYHKVEWRGEDYADPEGFDDTELQRLWSHLVAAGVLYVADWGNKWKADHRDRWLRAATGARDLIEPLGLGDGSWRDARPRYDGLWLTVFGQASPSRGEAILLVRNSAYYPVLIRDARRLAAKDGRDPFKASETVAAPYTGSIAIDMPDGDYSIAFHSIDDGRIEKTAKATARAGVLPVPLDAFRTINALHVKRINGTEGNVDMAMQNVLAKVESMEAAVTALADAADRAAAAVAAAGSDRDTSALEARLDTVHAKLTQAIAVLNDAANTAGGAT